MERRQIVIVEVFDPRHRNKDDILSDEEICPRIVTYLLLQGVNICDTIRDSCELMTPFVTTVDCDTYQGVTGQHHCQIYTALDTGCLCVCPLISTNTEHMCLSFGGNIRFGSLLWSVGLVVDPGNFIYTFRFMSILLEYCSICIVLISIFYISYC